MVRSVPRRAEAQFRAELREGTPGHQLARGSPTRSTPTSSSSGAGVSVGSPVCYSAAPARRLRNTHTGPSSSCPSRRRDANVHRMGPGPSALALRPLHDASWRNRRTSVPTGRFAMTASVSADDTSTPSTLSRRAMELSHDSGVSLSEGAQHLMRSPREARFLSNSLSPSSTKTAHRVRTRVRACPAPACDKRLGYALSLGGRLTSRVGRTMSLQRPA